MVPVLVVVLVVVFVVLLVVVLRLGLVDALVMWATPKIRVTVQLQVEAMVVKQLLLASQTHILFRIPL